MRSVLALVLFSLSTSVFLDSLQPFSIDDCLAAEVGTSGDDISTLLAAANESFRDDEDFDRGQLCDALSRYERIFELDPAHAEALNKSSQGYFMLGLVYLEDKDQQIEAYLRGRERGLTRLGVELPSNLNFVCPVSLPIIEALQNSEDLSEDASELAGLFWAGNNWGRWLDSLPEIERISKGFSDLPCIQTTFEKAVELDETYFGAGPLRALGSFIAGLPGPNLVLAREKIERAIELAPDYLENKVLLACGVAVPLGERQLFDQLLDEVLNASNIEQYFFWNSRARGLASSLLSSVDEFFPESGFGQCSL